MNNLGRAYYYSQMSFAIYLDVYPSEEHPKNYKIALLFLEWGVSRSCTVNLSRSLAQLEAVNRTAGCTSLLLLTS